MKNKKLSTNAVSTRTYRGKTYRKQQKQRARQEFYWFLIVLAFTTSVFTLATKLKQPLYHTKVLVNLPTDRQIDNTDPVSINKNIIREVAESREFKDIPLLMCLAKYESSFNPYAVLVNIHKQSDGTVLNTYDRGIFQLNSYWQRQVKNDCAFDTACSTNEVISILNREGNANLWVASKFCK